MGDLVEQLREEGLGFGIGPAMLCQEAAAEITRLRAALADAQTVGFAANAPERDNMPDTIMAWPDFDGCITGAWSANQYSDERAREYISRTHCDELVAAAYLDAGWKPIQTAPRDGSWFVACAVSPEFSIAKVVHFDDEHDRFPVTGLRDEAWARAPTQWMPVPESAPAPDNPRAARTAYGERMKADLAEAQAKIARLKEPDHE